MLRDFHAFLGAASDTWFWAVQGSAILTMFIGNLAALVQTNLKRMLAYSSIAHAGYILVAFAAGTAVCACRRVLYLATYVFDAGRRIPGGNAPGPAW